MSTEQKILVDYKEAASMLSIGKSTFLKYVKEQKVPQPVRIGRAVRWRVSELQAAFGGQSSSPTTP